jgi:hypothetical protein
MPISWCLHALLSAFARQLLASSYRTGSKIADMGWTDARARRQRRRHAGVRLIGSLVGLIAFGGRPFRVARTAHEDAVCDPFKRTVATRVKEARASRRLDELRQMLAPGEP